VSTVDPVAALLADVSRPVRPRLDFERALLQRLLSELHPVVTSSALRPRRTLPRWFLPGVPWRVRVALVLMALLLLLAGVAAATYLGVRSWVAGPGTVQLAGDYRLSLILDQPSAGTRYSSFTLDAKRHDLYAIRFVPGARPRPALVRLRGFGTSSPGRPQTVLELRSLAQSRYWGSSVDVSADGIYGWTSPAVSSAGEVFVAVQALTPRRTQDVSLIEIRPGGSPQKVISVVDLEQSGVLPRSGEPRRLVVTSMAPDRLWLIATVARGQGSMSAFLEVIDPDGDGNWSDRVVRKITLPRTVPATAGRRYWEFSQLVAEPSLHSDGRSRSVLAMAWSDEFRLYRINDRNGDGDVLDPGEVRLILNGHGPPKGWPTFALRSAIGAGGARGGLAMVGLERYDRLSLVSEGRVADVVRALPGDVWYPWQPVSGRSGEVYVIGSDRRLRAYQLSTTSSDGQQRAPIPQLVSQTPFPASSARAPLLITSRRGSYWAGADGSVVARLAPKTSWSSCQSADGRALAYESHAEVPGEDFLFVANAAGAARKISERLGDYVVCPFSKRWLLLAGSQSYSSSWDQRLVRHDLKTGREVVVAHAVDGPTVSPDGTRVVYLGGADYSGGFPGTGRRALELVDLTTLEHRRLADPPLMLTERPFFGGLTWSPDGSRIAYMTRPVSYRRHAGPAERWPPRATDLWVQNVTTSRRERIIRVTGSPASFSWSPDGKELLVCVEKQGTRTGCSSAHRPALNTARLLLVRASGGPARVVANGRLVFVAWAPSGRAFAYATPRALFLRTLDGRTRRLADAPKEGWALWGAGAPGWSPDGQYFGYTLERRGSPEGLAVLDLRSGRVRLLRGVTGVWWRSPADDTPGKGGS